MAATAVAEGTALERGDFAAGEYLADVHRSPDRITVALARTGNAWGIPFTLTKSITVAAGTPTLEIAYRLTGLPPDFRQHLAVEFNFAGLPARAEGRHFADEAGRDLGELGTHLDLPLARSLALRDGWLDIEARLEFAAATNGAEAGVWTFPIQSVSQSEGGFELVHQSVVVMPHWIVTPDAAGCWGMTLRLTLGRAAARITPGGPPPGGGRAAA